MYRPNGDRMPYGHTHFGRRVVIFRMAKKRAEHELDFENSLAMRLRGVYLTMHRRAQVIFDPWHVTADQYVLMRLVAGTPGINQKELVSRSYSDPSTIAAMAKLLHRRGLIERRESEKDRRTWTLYLTAKGSALLTELIRVDKLHRVLEAVVEENLGEPLAITLTAIVDALEKE